MKIKNIHRVISFYTIPQLITLLLLTGLLFAIIYILNCNSVIEFDISNIELISFLCLIFAVSGTIGAIMVGFTVSKMQEIQSQRMKWYFELKKEIREYSKILHNLKEKYVKLDKPLDISIKYLENFNITNNFFATEIDWEVIQKPSHIVFNDDTIDSRDVDVYNLIQVTVRVEEYIGELSKNWIESNIVSDLLVKSSIKLFIIVIASLIVLAYFTIYGSKNIYNPILLLTLVILFTIYFILVTIEIITHIKDYYREVSNSNTDVDDNKH